MLTFDDIVTVLLNSIVEVSSLKMLSRKSLPCGIVLNIKYLT